MVHKIKGLRNDTVADLFARGATEGESNHMFIEGNVVYSYGHHFPIAVRKGGVIYFNSDGYSSTTAHHKGLVRRALSGSDVVMKNTGELKAMI